MYELPDIMSTNTPDREIFPVVLMLHITTPPGGRDHLIDFLRQALPYYQEPGGIRVRLLSSIDQPEEYIEMIEYQTREGYLCDQQRVTQDVKMKGYLNQWYTLLEGRVIAKPYFDLSATLFKAENQ